ncbi:MAG: NAD(P)-dependent oxidoreductase [Candidatus Rokuibacteriota bacterium]
MSAGLKAPVTIIVPDDFPSVFDRTPAHERCRTVGETRVFTARGADEETELIKRIDTARIAINIRAHARFTDRVMEACRKLEMISIWGTGTDNIDLDAAGRHGITVCNTPGINAFAVAEHALALMLATARRIPRIDHEVRAGGWPRDLLTQLLGKTLGVFGTGKIGGRVIALGKALGMDVLAYSARGDAAAVAALGAQAASKDDILRRADLISLHLRLAPDTRGFLGRREFAMVKPTAILINTGRGALVEREALLDALTQNKLSGAGLDVFHDEPIKPGDPFLALPNVVLSPHNAGQTPEVIRDGLLRAIENVENYLAGKPTDVVVAPVKARR